MGGVSDVRTGGGVQTPACRWMNVRSRVGGVSISTSGWEGPWRLMDMVRWKHGDIIRLVHGW